MQKYMQNIVNANSNNAKTTDDFTSKETTFRLNAKVCFQFCARSEALSFIVSKWKQQVDVCSEVFVPFVRSSYGNRLSCQSWFCWSHLITFVIFNPFFNSMRFFIIYVKGFLDGFWCWECLQYSYFAFSSSFLFALFCGCFNVCLVLNLKVWLLPVNSKMLLV